MELFYHFIHSHAPEWSKGPRARGAISDTNGEGWVRSLQKLKKIQSIL